MYIADLKLIGESEIGMSVFGIGYLGFKKLKWSSCPFESYQNLNVKGHTEFKITAFCAQTGLLHRIGSKAYHGIDNVIT